MGVMRDVKLSMDSDGNVRVSGISNYRFISRYADLNSALDSLPDAGGIVIVEPGTWSLGTRPITLSSNQGIIGLGSNCVLHNEDDTSTGVHTISAIGTIGTPLTNVQVKNIKLTGVSGGGQGIHFEYVQDYTISDVQIDGVGDHGIYLENCTNGMLNNIKSDNSHDGSGYYLITSDDTRLINCTGTGNEYYGIEVQPATTDTYISNDIDAFEGNNVGDMIDLGDNTTWGESVSNYIVYKSDSTYYAKATSPTLSNYYGNVFITVMQDAIDAVASLGTGEIRIKEGTYTVTGAMTIQNVGIRIVGSGRRTTTLTLDDNVNTFIFDVGNPATGLEGVEIAHIGFDGNSATNATGSGIRIRGVHKSHIHDLFFNDFGDYGVYVNGYGGPTVQTVGCVFSDIHVIGTGDQAAFYMGEYTADNQLRNVFTEGHKYGIHLYAATSTSLSQCMIDQADGSLVATHGLFIVDSSYTQVENCRFMATNCSNANKYLVQLQSTGINSTGTSFIGNQLTGGTNCLVLLGIFSDAAYDVNRVIIRNNIFASNYGYAVAWAGAGTHTDHQVEGNIIKDYASAALATPPAAIHFVRDNTGYNPIGVIATPFDSVNNFIETSGASATPNASTDYTVIGSNIKISSTDSGNTDCAIMLKDPSTNNVLQAALSTVEEMYVPVGFILNWGAYTGAAPTVTVAFD